MFAADNDVHFADARCIEQQLGVFKDAPVWIVLSQGKQGAKQSRTWLSGGGKEECRLLGPALAQAAHFGTNEGIALVQEELRALMKLIAFSVWPQQGIDEDMGRKADVGL